MIIVSFLVFVCMFVWLLGSLLCIVIPLACADGNGKGFAVLCAAVFSLVVWYQVLVWGKPWFLYLISVWG